MCLARVGTAVGIKWAVGYYLIDPVFRKRPRPRWGLGETTGGARGACWKHVFCGKQLYFRLKMCQKIFILVFTLLMWAQFLQFDNILSYLFLKINQLEYI